MKRIFVKHPLADCGIAPESVFARDYRATLRRSMLLGPDGIYRSCGRPIDLSLYERASHAYVAGWDLGNGNRLSPPRKVAECQAARVAGRIFVAYTVCTPAAVRLVVVEPDRALWDDPKANALDGPTTTLLVHAYGFNTRLRFDGTTLLWRQYPSARPGDAFRSFRYDLTTGQTTEIKEIAEECAASLLRPATCGRASLQLLPGCGVWCIHLRPDGLAAPAPAVVVCPGGPFCERPALDALPTLLRRMADAGMHVVMPLRRGVRGISPQWEQALRGNYGRADVADIIAATHELAADPAAAIDPSRIALYGASYGGFSALLICGKHNQPPALGQRPLYHRVVSHCGVFDLEAYPHHCSGNPDDVRREYGAAADINPAAFAHRWQVPVLLVHTLDDPTSWFGQSVLAYNLALRRHAPSSRPVPSASRHAPSVSRPAPSVSLLLADGGHSYSIPAERPLADAIISFLQSP